MIYDEKIFLESLSENKIIKYVPYFRDVLKTYIRLYNSKYAESKNVEKIEQRKAKFKTEVLKFKEKYSSNMLSNFFEYWTEHGINDKKMRFEKQESFGLSRRLSTWERNNKKFNNSTEKKLNEIK